MKVAKAASTSLAGISGAF